MDNDTRGECRKNGGKPAWAGYLALCMTCIMFGVAIGLVSGNLSLWLSLGLFFGLTGGLWASALGKGDGE